MKKVSALLFTLLMIILLVACGSSSDNEITDNQNETFDQNEVNSDEAVVEASLSITDDGTVGTLKATGNSVDDFIKLKENGKECFFFIDLCDSTEETLYTFNLEVLSDGWSYRMDDEITGESHDANGDIGDGVIEFSFEVGVLDLTELTSAYFGYFDDKDEYFNGDYFDVSEIQISLTDKSSNEELDDEQQGEDSEEDDTDNNSWVGKYIVSSGSSETYQERASDTLIVTENTITFSFDDTEFVLDYDINSLVTAPELSNYGAGENDAAYASSNDNDFIIVFSDFPDKDIMIFNTTLLDEESYFLFTLIYEEESSSDIDVSITVIDDTFIKEHQGDYEDGYFLDEYPKMTITENGIIAILTDIDSSTDDYHEGNILGAKFTEDATTGHIIIETTLSNRKGVAKVAKITYDGTFFFVEIDGESVADYMQKLSEE